jgi:hypothetical protein
MGTTFYAAKAPLNPENLRGWKLGKLSCHMSGTNAGRILILLGYREAEVPELSIGGDCPVTEFLLRLSVAQIEGIPVACQRFGWSVEYVQLRLAELVDVAREAERMGGEVAWA